jgi:hypothetical protein
MEDQNKIPKVIHCCWLSGDPMPEQYQECLDSWKRHMPEYEIVVWDGKRFPIASVRFVKQAYEARKWAYASDYIRLYALYHHGGIYLDLDVFVYRSFDPFLRHGAFSSIEFDHRAFYDQLRKKAKCPVGVGIEAAVIGARKGHPWIRDLMGFYENREFINEHDYYWNIIMPRVMTKVSVEKYGFKYIPVYQVLKEDVHIYPPDVFSMQNPPCEIKYATHICAHSWYEGKKAAPYRKFILEKIIGLNNWRRIKEFVGKRRQRRETKGGLFDFDNYYGKENYRNKPE